MTYQETLDWIFTQVPMYQRDGQKAYKGDLNNTLLLDDYFKHPHQNYKTIHVAGTNGKGSVSHMIASILQEAGYRTGLYTSPHLKDFRERIKINGEMISEEYVTNFIQNNKAKFSEIEPSFFEMTAAMAFCYFAEQKIDVAVIEVGLGGRLDSTNIITPDISIITNIAFDHMALLGNTLPKIAFEKAGIIKQGIPAIVGIRDNEYANVFEEKAALVKAPLTFASDNCKAVRNENGNYTLTSTHGWNFQNVEAELKGIYQRKNIPTVMEAIHILRTKNYHISDENFLQGIARTVSNTGLMGRWQKLAEKPLTICDTGHNVDGLTEVTAQLRMCKYQKLHFVIGMVSDKDITSVLQLLPKEAVYYFTKAAIPRALNESALAEKGRAAGLNGNTYPTIAQAYSAAQDNATPDDMIFIGGSTFTVAEVI